MTDEKNGKISTRQFYEMQIETNKEISKIRTLVEKHVEGSNIRIGKNEDEIGSIRKRSNMWDIINTTGAIVGAFLGIKLGPK